MDTLLQDLRHAGRRLRRAPGFTAVATLTLALGIGGTALVLSALEALLLRPLPYPDPARLVLVQQVDARIGERPVAPANFLDWRERTRSFEGLAAWAVLGRTLLGSESAVRVSAGVVSSNFFDILGARPARGRTFGSASDGPREAVLGHSLWRSRFGAEESVIGREVPLDGEVVRVVAVMPAGFAFPREAELWLRAGHDVPEIPIAPAADPRPVRDSRYLGVLGRLRPKVTLEAASAEMSQVAAALAAEYPDANAGNGARVSPLFEELRGGARPALVLLLAAAGCVLLIVCANVANLLLARAISRRGELALRAALGASRGRLSRQLLTETLLLVALGTGLGLTLAWAGLPILLALWPASLPPLEGLRLAGPVLVFSSLLAAACVLLVGLVPAREAARSDALSGLRSGGRAPLAGPEAHRARGTLVVVEVALAVVLVSGCGLVLRSLWHLQQAPLGFRPEGVLSGRLDLPRGLSGDPAALRTFATALEDRLRTLPGVAATGIVQLPPLSGRRVSAGLRVEGHEIAPNQALDACWRLVTPEWLTALGVPLLKGRPFDDRDRAGTERVALVNATLARMAFGGEDPVGRRISTGLDGPEGTWVKVVGVVADTPQESVAAVVRPEMYRPLAQDYRMGPSFLHVLVRTGGDPRSLAPLLPRTVSEVRGDVTVSHIQPLTTLAAESISKQSAASRVLGIFAGLALFLAALGLYGVVSCLVGERIHEMGVRLALGARPSSLVSLVLGRSLALTALGLLTGLLVALALSGLLEGLLFGVGARDPVTLLSVVAVLFVAAAAAAWPPAYRASRVDPAVVMRSE